MRPRAEHRRVQRLFHDRARAGRRPRLRNWLFDKSEQCAPFYDIDTRDFAPDDRTAFWAAVTSAFDALATRSAPGFLDEANSWTANCLNNLLTAKRAIDAGDPPPDDVRPPFGSVDLDETWMKSPMIEQEFARHEAAFQEFLASKAAGAAD